ncbi:hypothetical protein E3A20_01330 [Planctomyces bekefii]|uniref:Uncharacterized protein n=1 Tax=Planctomyces bekefii TaxID=1653850 RepID=A0A5C6MCI2_9PLAN|nr:hypothetical protein E3A20_01330 [Planctomyces bekefii]
MGKVRHESPTVSRPAIDEQAFLKGKMCIFELHDLDNSTVDAVALAAVPQENHGDQSPWPGFRNREIVKTVILCCCGGLRRDPQ